MPRLPGFLDRLRRVVAPPGRPSDAVGVPASGDDLAAEIGPLLEQLDAIGAEGERLLADARDEAVRRREAGLRESEAILQEARRGADAERARAASVRPGGAQPAAAAADAELERIAGIREERLAALVAEVVGCVRQSAS